MVCFIFFMVYLAPDIPGFACCTPTLLQLRNATDSTDKPPKPTTLK